MNIWTCLQTNSRTGDVQVIGGTLHMSMSIQPKGARKCYKSHANDLTINRMGQTNWQTIWSNSADKLHMSKRTISTFIVRWDKHWTAIWTQFQEERRPRKETCTTSKLSCSNSIWWNKAVFQAACMKGRIETFIGRSEFGIWALNH